MRINWSGVVSILVLIVAPLQLLRSMHEIKRETLRLATAWREFRPDLDFKAAVSNYLKEADERTRTLDAAGRELRELTRRLTERSERTQQSTTELRAELRRWDEEFDRRSAALLATDRDELRADLRQLDEAFQRSTVAMQSKGRDVLDTLLRRIETRQQLREGLERTPTINGTVCGQHLLQGLHEFQRCTLHAVLPLARVASAMISGEWLQVAHLGQGTTADYLRLVQRGVALSNVCRRQLWVRTTWCQPAYRGHADELEVVFGRSQMCVPAHARDGPWQGTLDRCVARPGVPEGVQRLPVGLCPRGVGPLSQ